MPAFTVGLCKLPASLRMSLPLTDSRNRLDRDLVELGRWREVCLLPALRPNVTGTCEPCLWDRSGGLNPL